MSKNMTRKGLALGVGAALVASTFGLAPANAAGLADKTFVSLTPRVGTEYTVLLDQYFDLKSNVADALAVSGRDLKFLVSDPQSRVFVDQSQTTTDASASYTYAASATSGADLLSAAYTAVGTSTVATVDTTAVTSGQKFLMHSLTATTALNGALFAYTSGTTVTHSTTSLGGSNSSPSMAGGVLENIVGLNTRTAILANGSLADADLFESANITQSITGKTLTNGRASDGTFVVDTNEYSNAADRLLRLVTNSASTYSVVVTAWVDSNNNGIIDDTEYTSPDRTVTFVKPGDVTAVTTLNPVVGDDNFVAQITTTPVLNGEQVLAQDPIFLNAKFTRSLSTSDVYSDVKSGATAVWTDLTKTWSVTVSLDADAAGEKNAPESADVTDTWAGVSGPIAGTGNVSKVEISTAGLVTITTINDHGLRNGDLITFKGDAGTGLDVTSSSANDAGLDKAEVTKASVTVTGLKTFTYSMATGVTKPTTAFSDSSILAANDTYSVETYSSNLGLVDKVGAETYTARAVIRTAAAVWTAISATAEKGSIAAATKSAEVSTKASTSVQGKVFTTDSASNNVAVLTGTKSVEVTFTALDVDGDPLGAGRAVKVDRTVVSSVTDTVRINGKTTDTVLTDANGKATVTITAANGTKDLEVNITGVVENLVTVRLDLVWQDVEFGLVDLATTSSSVSKAVAPGEVRTMQELGSYTMNLAVLDQWYNAPAAGAYRLKLTGEGVNASFVTLTNGRANVTVTDTGVFGTQVITNIDLEKLSGTTVTATTPYVVTADVVKTFKVTLGANGSTLYSPSSPQVAADLADLVAEETLVELDKRVQAGVTPDYANDVVVNGQITNSATSAGKQGALVTISGPSNILFSNGEKAARGSLTFLSASNGNFEVTLYSTTAQTDTVITVTSNGASATSKVTFTGIGAGEGTKLDVTTPAAVKPASTFQVKAKLSDVYGNGVDTSAGRVKVTYTGAGIVFGTLPDQTDANGELMFSVLLGSNDTGNIVVTVSYDQNGDADYVDAKDLNTTKTIVISASGSVTTGKVNVGSFNGKLVVYAANLNGARISWKVGGNWGSAVADSNYDIFNRPTPRAGVTVTVDIYVNGVKTLTKSVVTR